MIGKAVSEERAKFGKSHRSEQAKTPAPPKLQDLHQVCSARWRS